MGTRRIEPIETKPIEGGRRFPEMVTTSDLSRSPGRVLDRVERGQRLLVCRHGRPIATLQPLDGVVVQPFTGGATDIFGWPVGGALEEAAKLTPLQRALLTECVSGLRIRSIRVWGRFKDEQTMPALRQLAVIGLAHKTQRGWELTGRGLVMHEALAGAAGISR